jgi:signal transduction histidine kinase
MAINAAFEEPVMNNDNQISPRPGGFGLRSRLSLGFVGLLAILLAVGVESITLLDRLGGSIDVILRENYKSVIACERMKESLERMDSGALFALAGHAQQGSGLAREHRPRFEAALETELGNITLPGEGERAQRLRQLFAAYTPVLDRVLDPQVSLEERRALYFQNLFPTFQQIKATADEILQLNQQNMVEANDRARGLAAGASRRMAVLLLLGTALAGLCIAFVLRSVLVPLERLTRAARLANAARDLDGALTPVRSALDALKAEQAPLTPSQEDLLDSVRQETDRLGQIAQNLLTLSRGEEGRKEFQLEPAAPRDLIEEAVARAADGYASQQVRLAMEVDPTAPHVLADRKRVDQVFSSLLQNALAHTPAGGSVTVRAEPEGDRARFSVSDTGSGIPPVYVEKVFEPFVQIPGTEDLGGIGLGLTIARDIVQAHGGEIHGESAEGRGATFWFTLPAASAGRPASEEV